MSDEVIWKRWHGRTKDSPPSDWSGGECYFGDGETGTPKGYQWGAFGENMVAFYPVTTPDAVAAETERCADKAEFRIGEYDDGSEICRLVVHYDKTGDCADTIWLQRDLGGEWVTIDEPFAEELCAAIMQSAQAIRQGRG